MKKNQVSNVQPTDCSTTVRDREGDNCGEIYEAIGVEKNCTFLIVGCATDQIEIRLIIGIVLFSFGGYMLYKMIKAATQKGS